MRWRAGVLDGLQVPGLALEERSIEMELAGIDGIHLIPNSQRSAEEPSSEPNGFGAGAASAGAASLPVLSLLQADGNAPADGDDLAKPAAGSVHTRARAHTHTSAHRSTAEPYPPSVSGARC